MSELRKDPITGRWVIIASERSKRPKEFDTLRADPLPGVCPFCYGNESLTPPEVLSFRHPRKDPDEPDWWVRVIPNKYPALTDGGEPLRSAEGMYDMINGVGVHEVIVETPDHQIPMAALPVEHIREIIWAYRERINDLSANPKIGYILIFKNHGPSAGASLDHPHTQLIATPIVPVLVEEELKGARKYFKYKERCAFCDMIAHERRKPLRLLEATESFIAIEPFASRFPFETWIMPRHHSCHFNTILDREVEDLAGILKRTLGRMWNVLDDPPFNFMLHVAPPHDECNPYYHWHIEIIPKLTTVAGFEWGSGFYINPTSPEEACRFLRDAEWEVPYTKPNRVFQGQNK
ncbi:MAG: galactose-1-phosphate uridylyltransferase [Candidatus Omnitrophica bacterium]|nr:galactose-1-phosphate uridylyltransferase [Candidatus Omnitrophota bacterium]